MVDINYHSTFNCFYRHTIVIDLSSWCISNCAEKRKHEWLECCIKITFLLWLLQWKFMSFIWNLKTNKQSFLPFLVSLLFLSLSYSTSKQRESQSCEMEINKSYSNGNHREGGKKNEKIIGNWWFMVWRRSDLERLKIKARNQIQNENRSGAIELSPFEEGAQDESWLMRAWRQLCLVGTTC